MNSKLATSFLKWIAEGRAQRDRQLAMIYSGDLRITERRNGQMVDVTPEVTEYIKRRGKALDRLLTKYRRTQAPKIPRRRWHVRDAAVRRGSG